MNDALVSSADVEQFERLQRWGWTADPSVAAAKVAALAAVSDLAPPEPIASVSYVSGGRLLVIAPAEAREPARMAVESLRQELDVHMIAAGHEPVRQPGGEGILVWHGIAQSLTGYLGAFEATWRGGAAEPASQTPSAPVVLAQSGELPVVQYDPATGQYSGKFDLVLDFSVPPLFTMHQPPQGYFAVGADPGKREAACAELAEMVGEFEKPKFFAYKEKICAHSRSRKSGCNLCIEICSTRAISADGDHVKVDAHLCMGCGACATVCPSGAMSYQYPRVADRGAQFKTLLAAFKAASGENPCLLFHDGLAGRALLAQAAMQGRGLPPNVIPIETWHIASTGIDLLMGAVCFGATHIAMLSTGTEAPQYARALTEQMGYAQTILNALGYRGSHFSLLTAESPDELDTALSGIQPAIAPVKMAAFNLAND